MALFLASPFVLYQVWRFVAPGLYKKERRRAIPFIFFGSLFFIGGGAFAYYVAFPFAVDFLIGMGAAFQPMITVERYFRFLLYVILGLGLMFELPIIIFLLAQMGVVLTLSSAKPNRLASRPNPPPRVNPPTPV